MNYDETTVERFCSANNFCGIPMWLKYHNYLFSTVEEKSEETFTVLDADKLVGQWKEIARRGCFEDVFYLQQLVPLAIGYLQAQAEALLRQSNSQAVADHGEAAKASFEEAVRALGKGIEQLADCWKAYLSADAARDGFLN